MNNEVPDVPIKMPVIAKKQIETTPATVSILFTEPASVSTDKEELTNKVTHAKQPETTIAKKKTDFL
jgi:hypothetical protein